LSTNGVNGGFSDGIGKSILDPHGAGRPYCRVFLAARPQTIVSFSDAARLGSGEGEPMPEARVPKKTSSKRHELGREAPMIITPAALLRLIRRIRGRGTKR